MSNISDLQAAYLVEIAKITDPLSKIEAKTILDNLIAALTAEKSLAGQNLSSYSAAQVSITRRQIKDAQASVVQYRGELRRYLFGNVESPDMSAMESNFGSTN